MNKKLLLSSLMSIAMLASITTGATYALFTAEDTVNVQVTAGKVEVSAKVLENFKIKSLDTDLTQVTGVGYFTSGGSATVDSEGNITLERIVPGDKVEFDVEIKNDSNVKVNYQSVVSVDEGVELFSGLKITIDDTSDNEEKETFDGYTAYSTWENLNPGEGNRIVKVTVELPDTTADQNHLQGLSTTLKYTVKAVQGNSTVSNAPAEENTFYVYNESDLRLIAAKVNSGDNLKGKTVKLMSNIDLANHEWTPIGTTTNKFSGTFDGQNYTISNLNVGGEDQNYVGLFGYTTEGLIKNLNIHNADVDGRSGVGALAGSPYTTKYENITLTGKVTVDGMAYVGGLLGRNAYADLTNITIDVEDESYVNAYSIEDGIAYRTYVGGVVGFMGEGNHTVKNVTSNIDVLGSTVDVGGITGIAQYGNTFENCVSSGDVTIYSYGDEGDQYEIGGIAGVWNNAESQVTFTNCSFTGDLKAIHENGTEFSGEFYNDGLVGKAYSSSGKGVLVIDGKSFYTSSEDVKNKLAAGEDVEFGGNVNDTAAGSNGYGTTGLLHNGQVIDGNGYILNVKGANGTWDSAIHTKGGTIKNLTVNGAFRGIFVGQRGAATLPNDLYVENVVLDKVCYTFSADGNPGDSDKNVVFKNSTLNGWTSYSNMFGSVSFEGCKFGKGTGGYQYAYCRPYNNTTFTNCTFEKNYEFDSTCCTSTFVNCYVGTTLVTAENVTTLLGADAACIVFANA